MEIVIDNAMKPPDMIKNTLSGNVIIMIVPARIPDTELKEVPKVSMAPCTTPIFARSTFPRRTAFWDR